MSQDTPTAAFSQSVTPGYLERPGPRRRNWFQRMNRWWLEENEYFAPGVPLHGTSRLAVLAMAVTPLLNLFLLIFFAITTLSGSDSCWRRHRHPRRKPSAVRRFFLGPDEVDE